MPFVAVTGKIGIRTPNRSCSTVPMTKTGVAMTMSELTKIRLSAKPPRRMPATTPAEMPMTISKMIAITASLTVVG